MKTHTSDLTDPCFFSIPRKFENTNRELRRSIYLPRTLNVQLLYHLTSMIFLYLNCFVILFYKGTAKCSSRIMSVSYYRWLHAIQMAPALLSLLRLLKYIVENACRETRQSVFIRVFFFSLAYIANARSV